MYIDKQKTDLVGIPIPTLQQWLLDAQTAVHDLTVGGKPVVVTYAQGDGTRSVTYTPANIAGLHAYIQELKAQLGITRGRRAIRPYF